MSGEPHSAEANALAQGPSVPCSPQPRTVGHFSQRHTFNAVVCHVPSSKEALWIKL